MNANIYEHDGIVYCRFCDTALDAQNDDDFECDCLQAENLRLQANLEGIAKKQQAAAAIFDQTIGYYLENIQREEWLRAGALESYLQGMLQMAILFDCEAVQGMWLALSDQAEDEKDDGDVIRRFKIEIETQVDQEDGTIEFIARFAGDFDDEGIPKPGALDGRGEGEAVAAAVLLRKFAEKNNMPY